MLSSAKRVTGFLVTEKISRAHPLCSENQKVIFFLIFFSAKSEEPLDSMPLEFDIVLEASVL